MASKRKVLTLEERIKVIDLCKTKSARKVAEELESVDLLLDFMECSQGKPAEVSTLIVRNLCCHSSNKPKLLANDKLLPEIMKCIDCGVIPVQKVAISALWALVYNNQKAKVMMKNANVLPKLQEKMNNMYNQQTVPEKCLTDLQCVIEAVSE